MKASMLRIPAVAVLMIGLSGCAWTPHQVKVAPQVSVAPSDLGRDTKVFFRFTDERDDTTVGHRSVATVGAQITAPQLDDQVQLQLKDSLQKKGYQLVTSEAAADDTLTFRLRAFQFYIEKGYFSGGQEASAVLAVDALRRGLTYTNVYRHNSDQRIQFVPGGDDIDAQMNLVLSDILQQAATDTSLDAFLTGRAGGQTAAAAPPK